MKYRQSPSAWSLKALTQYCSDSPVMTCTESGAWEPARPLGEDTLVSRIRLAWAVFTGRADALFWSKP